MAVVLRDQQAFKAQGVQSVPLAKECLDPWVVQGSRECRGHQGPWDGRVSRAKMLLVARGGWASLVLLENPSWVRVVVLAPGGLPASMGPQGPRASLVRFRMLVQGEPVVCLDHQVSQDSMDLRVPRVLVGLVACWADAGQKEIVVTLVAPDARDAPDVRGCVVHVVSRVLMGRGHVVSRETQEHRVHVVPQVHKALWAPPVRRAHRAPKVRRTAKRV